MYEKRVGRDGREELWALRPVRLAVFDEPGLADRFVEVLGWDAELAEAPAEDGVRTGVCTFSDGSAGAFVSEPAFEVTAAGEAALAAGPAPDASGDEPATRMDLALDDMKAGMRLAAAAEKHAVHLPALRSVYAQWKARASDAELLAHEAAREAFRGAAS